MAEIPIERREHRGSLWAWLIGLVVLLLLIWLAATRRHVPQTAVAPGDTTSAAGEIAPAYPGATPGATGSAATPSVATASGAIAEFSRFIGAAGPNLTDAEQREYTAGGIRRLADALSSEGVTGPSIDNMHNKADALQSSGPASAKHSDMARAAFLSAADAFDSLKQSHPNLNAAGVRNAADAVKPGTHFLREKGDVQRFFDTARDALEQLSPVR
ncbi:MAG TPA: hypothetical protein VJN70_05320 [Gemmatimonadaceae bacterium]|nr:hypothetical protein [Gemmatimonadaceae bacterium]